MPNYKFGSDVNPENYSLGFSDNGWMTASVFFTWLSSVFYKEVKDTVRFPIIMFLDGHTSHLNLAVSDFCAENDIILYCFPAHSSHVLQPMDVTVFGPLKKRWNEQVEKFRREFHLALTRSHFFQVFDPVWKFALSKPENMKSGFKACGLVPFNVENINFSKLLKTNEAEKFNEEMKNVSRQVSNFHMKIFMMKIILTRLKLYK